MDELIITEDDFIDEIVEENSGIIFKIKKCIKYKSVYQLPDGKYYDDKAVIFKLKDRPDIQELYLYQESFSSKREISLPYTPNPKIVFIDSLINISNNDYS